MGEANWLNGRWRDSQAPLTDLGHTGRGPVISRWLKAAGYRLRLNVKAQEGAPTPERDQPLVHSREQRAAPRQAGQPTIRVDTKKKELVGNFKNAGRIGCQEAEAVNIHDFPSEAIGRAVPDGSYDLQHNRGTLYVGQSADTPTFAVDNLMHGCQTELPQRFPDATHLFIEADGGGSNASRSRVFNQPLQEKLAEGLGLTGTVCHYPPGTSTWNPMEHRLFSEISKTWAGCPLRSFDLLLDYLNDTHTHTGLTVQAPWVTTHYPTAVQVTDDAMEALNIQEHDPCPQGNYTIQPRAIPLS